MKYLIIGLNFLVENPQSPLENTIPPCGSALPPEKQTSTSPTLFKNASKFLDPPLQKAGGRGWEDTIVLHYTKSIENIININLFTFRLNSVFTTDTSSG